MWGCLLFLLALNDVLESIEDVTSSNVAMVGGEGEETMEIRKKPAKVTCQLIEAVCTTKAKQDAKAVTPIASIPSTGKCKPLKREGV